MCTTCMKGLYTEPELGKNHWGHNRTSTADQVFPESRKSSIGKEESCQEETNSRCMIGKTVAWLTFKNIVFLIFLIFVVIQSAEFYKIYSEYPTNIVQKSTVILNFTLPAVTICYRNTVSTKKFCLDNANLCQKPNNLEEFCNEHPLYCKDNADNPTNFTIPATGYYTNHSSEIEEIEKIAMSYLFNESFNDPELILNKRLYSRTRSFIEYDFHGSIFKCYSDNLHLFQSGSKLETVEVAFGRFRSILLYDLKQFKIHLFYPGSTPQIFFGIHSPFVPMNPMEEGYAVMPGYSYTLDVLLEKEEYLLPPPYQTSCRDNGPSEDVKSNTNPNSYQMCLDLCEAEVDKKLYNCSQNSLMIMSIDDLCIKNFDRINLTEQRELELENERFNCLQNCKPACLNLYYKSKLQENKDYSDNETSFIAIDILNEPVDMLHHVPVYGSGELFSYIGGLFGCWLGISVFTFIDFAEKLFQKALYWKMRFRIWQLQKTSPTENLA